jgi:hypothetical protein
LFLLSWDDFGGKDGVLEEVDVVGVEFAVSEFADDVDFLALP